MYVHCDAFALFGKFHFHRSPSKRPVFHPFLGLYLASDLDGVPAPPGHHCVLVDGTLPAASARGSTEVPGVGGKDVSYCPSYRCAKQGKYGHIEQRMCSTPDARVVLVIPDFFDTWERGVKSGNDMWTHVEDFITRKQRGLGGEIDRRCFLVRRRSAMLIHLSQQPRTFLTRAILGFDHDIQHSSLYRIQWCVRCTHMLVMRYSFFPVPKARTMPRAATSLLP
jgi:hypothetical protein